MRLAGKVVAVAAVVSVGTVAVAAIGLVTGLVILGVITSNEDQRNSSEGEEVMGVSTSNVHHLHAVPAA